MDIGSVAEWVGAVFTGLGFSGAIVQLRANLNDSRDAREQAKAEERERRTAMARAVGVKVLWQPGDNGGPPPGHDGLMPAHVEIMNSGPYPIDGAVLELAADEFPKEVVYGTLLPGQHVRDTHMVRRSEVVFGELSGGATLNFTDAYGNHWARSPLTLDRREEPARIC